MKTSVLTIANEIIYGDREKTYGAPDKNLQLIADLWGPYLQRTVTVDDVCNLMILLKVARLRNQPTHKDSQVDICGYAALMERVQQYRYSPQPIASTETRNALEPIDPRGI